MRMEMRVEILFWLSWTLKFVLLSALSVLKFLLKYPTIINPNLWFRSQGSNLELLI